MPDTEPPVNTDQQGASGLGWPGRTADGPPRRTMHRSAVGILLTTALFLALGLSGIWTRYTETALQQITGWFAAVGPPFKPTLTSVLPTTESTVYQTTSTPASQGAASAQPSPRATEMPSATPRPSVTAVPTAAPEPSETPELLPAWLTSEFLPLPTGKWIEVDLTRQVVTAHIGTRQVFSITASTGIDATTAAAGAYRITEKVVSSVLTGPGYYLPDVPWVLVASPTIMLHGAYWLDTFGAPSSHGSINLPLAEAERLFAWAEPALPAGAQSVTATASQPGTWVFVHP